MSFLVLSTGGGFVANCTRTAALRSARSYTFLPRGFPPAFTLGTVGCRDLPESMDIDNTGE